MAGPPRLLARRGAAKAEPTERGYRLVAETQWIVEGTSSELGAIQASLPRRITERLGSALLLRFGNAVGTFAVPHLGILEVRSSKWGERHFDAMLAAISARMAALPFAPGSGARGADERTQSDDERVLLHTFLYLRHLCSPLAAPEERVVQAFRLITEAPHRRFVRRPEWAPLATAKRVDPRGLTRLLAPQAGLTRVPVGAGGPLAGALGGHLPQQVEASLVRETLDVPENRFAKEALTQMHDVVERVRALAERRMTDYLRRRLLAECDEITRALAPAHRHPLWASVGQMSRLPVESVVLQQRRGYRELFKQFLRLRMAPRWPLRREQVERLLELKDIATLYELWVFFAVEEAVSSVLRRDPDRALAPRVDDFRAQLPWGISVAWGDVELFYNLQASRSRTSLHSYSLALRPDVSLRIPRGRNKGLHLFDAKFRLDRVVRMTREEDAVDDEDECDEQLGKFKHADIYKMHTYRDAIDEARSAWVMYPGSEFGMYESRGQARLVRDVHTLASIVEGVGALPSRPGAEAYELRALASVLLADVKGVHISADI